MFHIPAHKNVAAPAGQVVFGDYKNPPHQVKPPRADFAFADHGSICVLTPLSDEAREWCDENLPAGGLRWNCGYAIERRFVQDILDALECDCLEVV